MDAHRKVEPESVEIISLQEPFSIFEFIGVRFGGHNALHRCFSLARTSDCLTVVLENIPPVGILAEEVEDLAPLTSLYRLSRISFWKSGLENVETIADQDSEDLIGYVIFKEDDFKAKEPKAIHRHVLRRFFENTLTRTTVLRIRGCMNSRLRETTW